MSKIDIFYRAINDLAHLKSSSLSNNDIKKFKKYFRKVFLKTYFFKFLSSNYESFKEFKINSYNYKDFFFLFRDIFVRQEYLFRTDNKSPLILDCGANIGLATIYFKWLYPDSEIHAFEPDLDTFKMLKQNIEINNYKNVFLYNSAVSDFNGTLDFYIDKSRPGSLVMSTIFDRLPKDKIEVESISLSDFIASKLNNRKIDLLKMDIEGAEHSVLNNIMQNQQLGIFNEVILEYHHNIGNEDSKLGGLLKSFENAGFKYQIEAENLNLYQQNAFQDLLIYFYKK